MEPPELGNPPPKSTEEEKSDEDASDHDSEEEECDVAEMKKTRSKSLVEFRFRVEEAIRGNYLLVRKNDDHSENAEDFRDIRLWGVPLLPSHGHEGTDTVLMKFLKAKRYKVHEAFTLLRKTLKWRGDFRPDEVVGEEFRPEINDLWFTSGRDKIGRPLCYIILGKEWQKKMLSTEEYLRWRVLCLEKGIQNLSFRPGGVDSLVQIVDLKNSPGTASKELIINVPSWFMALNTLNLRLITQKSRNKFIFVKSSKVTETLLKYATAENLLVEYGGLKRENDTEFSTDDKVLEVNIRPGTTELIQIPTNEVGVTLTWDVTVLGYEVGYKEEFVPDDDCSYIVLIQEKKMLESIRNSFHIREPGKIVITIVNGAYTKKKAFYRPLFLLYKYQRFSSAAPTKSIYYSSSFHHHTFLSILFHIMVKLFLSVLSLLLLFGLGSAVRGAPGNRASAKSEVSMLENHLIASKRKVECLNSGISRTMNSNALKNNLRSKEGRGFRDRHQKIEEFREGDIVAISAGAARWAYSDGDQELAVVVLHDNTNNANQLDQNPSVKQKSRRFRRREYGREEEEGYYGGDNRLEETICSAKIGENLDKPSRTDVYNRRAGRFSTVNSLTLPILGFLQLSAARGVLYRHSLRYARRGPDADSDHRGAAVFDGGIREGQVVVVPQNFAAAKQAGEEGCEWVEFNTKANAMISTLSGRTSAMRGLPVDVIATAYQITREEVERLKLSRRETIIFSGSGRSGRGRVASA
ncbi:UNVERIFIED_CONTAM: Patellin-4 [Sesamum radiatum]|uniref:Patellin-4 n=1 Tax=Sesamum radiatum TaxID=300843 RepID=A0AAW2W5X5_SESRA